MQGEHSHHHNSPTLALIVKYGELAKLILAFHSKVIRIRLSGIHQEELWISSNEMD